MANNISIIPSSSPGDFTVGGILTVNGGLIKIPVSTYFIRFGTFGAAGDGFTVNKQSDVNGQDDTSKWANSMLFDTATGRQGGTRQGPSLPDQIWHRGAEVFSNSATLDTTGVTGAGNLWTQVFSLGQFDRSGFPFIRIRVAGKIVTAVGGAVTWSFQIGSISINVANVTASLTKGIMAECIVFFNSTTSKIAFQAVGIIDGGAVGAVTQDSDLDGTAAFNVLLNYNHSAVGDDSKIFARHVQHYNTH